MDGDDKDYPLLTVGLILDPMFAGRLVDRGPPAEDGPAARKFREFWGEKSELRRCAFCCSTSVCVRAFLVGCGVLVDVVVSSFVRACTYALRDRRCYLGGYAACCMLRQTIPSSPGGVGFVCVCVFFCVVSLAGVVSSSFV